jgi:hypothetical protein
MNKLLLLTILLAVLSCKGEDCETLPTTFASYSEATSKITNATYSFSDSVNTSASSWIEDASFFSCDGTKGFLVIETSKQNYIFRNVPIQVWNNFKEAKSFGVFYNNFIRGKFQLAI